MAIYSKNGGALSGAYGVTGAGLLSAYNVTGTQVFGGGGGDDYDEWTTEYQHTILQARDAWAAEYRTDSTIVPLVISTDQHGTLSGQWAKGLYSYLSLAVNWSECSACLNLGDVVASSYDETALNAMVSTLSPIPKAKQINLVGNHDTWGAWTSDSSLDAPTQAFWSSLLSFFDNSGYNGYIRLGTHQTAEYMVDTAKKIKYVVVGGWDYNKQIGGYSHYLIDSDNLDAIISALSAVDDKDIILLSHIQPFNGTLQYGHDIWQLPAVDGNEATSEDRVIEPMVNRAETTLNALFNARKAKTSGTVNDSYGNTHSFDFTNCTSNLLCTLHGHWHEDLYNWYENDNIPTVLFDSMHYDNHPFFFVNVDRTRQRLSIWKVDDSPTFYHYTIPFEKAVNT